MKNTLLLFSMLVAMTSFGQKKITAISKKYYDESAVLQFIDSTSYIYSSWQGSINELKPKFKFAGDIISFTLDEVFVHCNTENRYSGNPSLIILDYTLNNTLTNGLVTEANNTGSIRTLYEYYTTGKVKSKTVQFDNSSNWQTQDSTFYTYDSFGNQLTMNIYTFSSPVPELNQSDSAWYISGSDKLTKYRSYYIDFSSNTLLLDYQTLVSYSGNNVQYLDLYYNNGSGGLDWTYRLNYNYTGATCTDLIAYDVVSNVPTTTVFASATFTYTTSNQPEQYSLLFGGIPQEKIEYTYSPDGFIENQDDYSPNSSNVLYKSNVTSYYYQNTANIDELVDATISIYPNPTKDFLTVNSASKIQKIQILNLNGQVVLEQNTNKADIHHLPSGSYIVRGNTDGGNFTKKIVKE